MKTGILLGAVALVTGLACAAAPKKLKVEDLPPAVQQTVKAQTQGATIVGLAKELEKGKTVYELESRLASGKTRDLMIDASGAVLSVEEEVALESLPAPARAALEKAAAGGKLTRIEMLTAGGAVSYEAAILKRGKRVSVTVKPDGTLVK